MTAAQQLAQETDVQSACSALGIPRATYYRWQKPKMSKALPGKKIKHPLALCAAERRAVLDILHSERFIDKSPGEIVPTLLDEGNYLCSERTMYRILAEEDELKERGRQRKNRNQYQKPELLATAPNQVWSWDISVPQQAV